MSSNNPGTGSDSLLGNEKPTRFDVHEVLSGMMTVGGNGSEAVSETDSPTSFSFYAGSGRDLQYDVEVLIENTASTTETVTISGTLSAGRMYDEDDEYTGTVADSGETLASDSVTVDVGAGGIGSVTLFEETQSLDNQNVSVDLNSDNSSVVINRTNTNTLGGTYRTTVDEGGGKVVQDHFGRNVEEVDPLEGATNYPHGLKKQGSDVINQRTLDAYKEFVENNYLNSEKTDTFSGEEFIVGESSQISFAQASALSKPFWKVLADNGTGNFAISQQGTGGYEFQVYSSNGDFTNAIAFVGGHRIFTTNNTGAGLQASSGTVSVDKARGLEFTNGQLEASPAVTQGIELNGADNIAVKAGNGIDTDSGTVNVRPARGQGIEINGNDNVGVKAGNAIDTDNGTVNVRPDTGRGITINGDNKLAIKTAGVANIENGYVVTRYDSSSFDTPTDGNGEYLTISTADGINRTSSGIEAAVDIDAGLRLDNGYIVIEPGDGIDTNNGTVNVSPATGQGIEVNGFGNVGVKTNGMLNINSNGELISRYDANDFDLLSDSGGDYLAVSSADGIDRTSSGLQASLDINRGLKFFSGFIGIKTGSGIGFDSFGRLTTTSSDGGQAADTPRIESENDHRNITVSGPTETFELDELPAPFDDQQPGNIQLTPLDRAAGEASWHVEYIRPDALKIAFHSEIPDGDELLFRLSLIE